LKEKKKKRVLSKTFSREDQSAFGSLLVCEVGIDVL